MKVREALGLRSFLEENSKTDKMGMSRVTLVMMLVKLGKVQDEYKNLYESVLDGLAKDIPDFDDNLRKAQAYEDAHNDESKKSDWGEKEYKRFIDNDFNKVIVPFDAAMKKELDKEVDVDYDKFDKQGFAEWMESNGVDAVQAASYAPLLLDM